MSYFLIFIFAIILEFNISNTIKRDVKRLLRDINNKNFTISSMDDKLKNNQTHSENFYELNLFVNLSESFRLKLYDNGMMHVLKDLNISNQDTNLINSNNTILKNAIINFLNFLGKENYKPKLNLFIEKDGKVYNSNFIYPNINIDFNKFKSITKNGPNFLKIFGYRQIKDPCFQKNFFNKTIIGQGNYLECYDKIKNSIKYESETFSSLLNNKNIDNKLSDVIEIINIENITLHSMKIFAKMLCEFNYTVFIDQTLCYRIVYNIVIIEKIFDDFSYSKLIHPYIENEKETLIIMIDSVENYVPLNSFLLIFSFFLIYAMSYVYKLNICDYIEKYFHFDKIEIANFYKNTYVDESITTYPIKQLIFSKFNHEIKTYFKEYTLYSFTDFKYYIFEMINIHKDILKAINEIYLFKIKFRILIFISIIQLILCFILSLMTTRIINYLFKNRNTLNFLLVFFSLLYMLVLVLESLKLIKYIENNKYYTDNIICYEENKFILEEYENKNFEYE